MPTLDWIGKKAVLNHDKEVPFHLLKCDSKLSVGDPGSGNLLVEGDNLLALKALLPYYAGQVKCIYIDPPYNTGNQQWTYNDAVNSPEIRQWLGRTVGREAEDLSRHDKWLCMMYPRLMLLHRFLRQDGVLFASIDDIEIDHLRLILDEIFGPSNRVGTIVWKNATDNNPTRIVPEHEYVLCYARELSQCSPVWKSANSDVKQRLVDIGDKLCAEISAPQERQDAYSNWLKKNKAFLSPLDRYKYIDEHGVFTGSQSVHNPGKEGYRYDVIHPRTGKPCKEPLMGYRFPPETMNRLLGEDRVLFGADENKIVELKVYAKDYRAKLSSVIELDGRTGTNEIKALFPESKRPFDFPKPTGLLEELLAFTTSGDDLVLDSFAGSGTTGQAVMQLNISDGQQRRFILVEMEREVARKITIERIKRFAAGIDTPKGMVGGTEVGVAFCSLGHPLFDEQGQIQSDVSFSELAAHVYFTETGEPMPKQATDMIPLLGVHQGRAIYLLYNGILGDKSVNGGNVLTRSVLKALPPHDGPKVIYGNGCRLGSDRLKREQITFRQTPYEIRVD